MEKLQGEYDELDQAHIKLRAAEFDKVDVLKLNAELEGKTKNMRIDIDNLSSERDRLRSTLDASNSQNEKLNEQVRLLSTELQYYRKSQDIQMDKFDKKFQEF